MSYQNGVEDALELCLSEMQKPHERGSSAMAMIHRYLRIVRANKTSELREQLKISGECLRV